MLKETIKFKDFNDQDREVTAYFYLNEKEIIDLQAHSEHGIQYDMEEAIKSNNPGKVLDYITNLVHLSYGIKSQDGTQFKKSPEILDDFIHAAYYSDFLVGLIQDNGTKGQEFIQGIMPKKLVDRALAQSQGQPVGPPDRTVQESTVYAQSAREQFAERTAQAPSEFVPSAAPTPIPTAPPADPEYQAFLQWKEQQAQAAQAAPQTRPDEAPDFRVPVEEEHQGLGRPVHEQNNSQQ